MVNRYGFAVLVLAICVGLCAVPAQAQWVRNGVLVCGEDNDQWVEKAMPDGRMGAIILWTDWRNGNADIYGNDVPRDGHVEGTGLAICTDPSDQSNPVFISDGIGGAIIAWMDLRSGDNDIYAQRVDTTGTPAWTTDGIPICVMMNDQSMPQIAPDGSGGAIIVWADYRSGAEDIYAQRVTSAGDTLWQANGMPVDTSLGDQWMQAIARDGAGGVYLAYGDTRNGAYYIYAQHLDPDGNLLWGTGGVPVCSSGNYQYCIQIAAAYGGGAVISWAENRFGIDDVFVQKLDDDGNPLWTPDGVIACPYPSNKYEPQLAADGSGGAILVWYDERDSNNYPLYAGRVDQDGNIAWNLNGIMVFPRYGENDPAIIPDGSGGAIVTMDTYDTEFSETDIYAQRLGQDGGTLWGAGGLLVCDAPDYQFSPRAAADGTGGAIIAWNDYRVGTGYLDIYAQRIGASGLWGEPEPVIASCMDVPQDQGGWVRIRARASSLDSPAETATPILGYNVWREISGGVPPPPSAGAVKTGALDRSKLLSLLGDPATAVGVRVSGDQAAALGLPGGEWESVGFWFATRDTMYTIAVPTKNDSTEAGTPWETYIVTAHAAVAGLFSASTPAQGYSVDNIAPGITMGLAGNETVSPAGLELTWAANGASDLWKYNLYRGTDDLFVPGPGNLIGSTNGTAIHDGTWAKLYGYYYKLVAVDRHGNMGPSALLRPEDVHVGTMLQSFAASLKMSAIEVSWRLSEVDEDVSFLVLRSADAGEFAELSAVEISRDGLSFTMSDGSVEPGTVYRYRVAVVDASGPRTLFETDAVSTPALPLTLYQNHPNPFNPSTTIGYYLPVSAPVTLEVYDPAGHLVSRLLDGVAQERGMHSIEWRGIDTAGRRVSSGVYFYRLRTGKDVLSRKMVLLR
jgi:hypothetical protein